MKCPNCGEQPNTFFQSIFPGREELKKNYKGRLSCRKCGAELAYQKTKNGFYTFESPFYILLSVLIIAIMTVMWALIMNLEGAFTPESHDTGIIILFIGMMSICLFGGLLSRKYILIEIYQPEDEQEDKEKASWLGMGLMLGYSILAIFGFGLLSNYATEYSFSPLVYVLSTLAYMGICIGIAFQIMNSSLFKPKGDK
ncbi:MAG: hypothetical protein CL670_13665 [Balneola sp.]|nr:hypothetical protein [Balneola sp.]MBE80199.1 hypothetical protein [Balneola sp.]|tara:strand:+ start:323 stop:916 length:594 start_codon:yes stop_codon:yes gene_type:complete